jgi:hypothetical protein
MEAAPTRGKFVKFDAKRRGYVITSDDTVIPLGTQVAVIYDQIQVGWMKFNGRGQPPERKMGALFAGFVPASRSDLGDEDQALWEIGLSGKTQDPWQQHICLPMQVVESGDLLIFDTSSQTGRNEANQVISLCNRMRRQNPEHFPVVKLELGGFDHKDTRIGRVHTPKFTHVGSAARTDVSAGLVSLNDEMSDAIPF